MSIEIPSFVLIPAVITLAWIAVWYVQTLVFLVVFRNADGMSPIWQVVFIVPVTVIGVMDSRPQSQGDSDAVAYMTWGIRFATLFWLSVFRLVIFAIATVAYLVFAICRRIVSMKHDVFTSYLFSMLQVEAGLLDPNRVQAEMTELTDQLAEAQMQAWESESRAYTLERDLSIQQQVAQMARANNWSQDELVRWAQRMTGQEVQPTDYFGEDIVGNDPALPSVSSVAYGNDLNWNPNGQFVDASSFGHIFDDDDELTDDEMEAFFAHLDKSGFNFRQ